MRRRILAALAPAPLEEAGGLPWEAIYPAAAPPAIRPPATAPTRSRRVLTTAGAGAIVALENPDRRQLSVTNATNGDAWLKLGYGATTSDYTYRVVSFATVILEPPDVWQGIVTAAFSGSTGSLVISEQ